MVKCFDKLNRTSHLLPLWGIIGWNGPVYPLSEKIAEEALRQLERRAVFNHGCHCDTSTSSSSSQKPVGQPDTYRPGRRGGSPARPAWWRTLPAGRCARTCTPPCLWSAAAPASSGTGSCSGRLSAASSRCTETRAARQTWAIARTNRLSRLTRWQKGEQPAEWNGTGNKDIWTDWLLGKWGHPSGPADFCQCRWEALQLHFIWII